MNQFDDGKAVRITDLAVLRATETWQQAGAYYVRIQAMAKKHHIPLRAEFDGHDGPDTRYVVVTDDDFPVATARIYPLDSQRVMIGRFPMCALHLTMPYELTDVNVHPNKWAFGFGIIGRRWNGNSVRGSLNRLSVVSVILT